jgi:hypothetical protein
LSVLSQCSVYHNTREVIARMNPKKRFDKRSLDRLANHIYDFSIAGIRALVAQRDGQQPVARVKKSSKQRV